MSASRMFHDFGNMAATVKSPSGGNAACRDMNRTACFRLQNVSGVCGETRRIFIATMPSRCTPASKRGDDPQQLTPHVAKFPWVHKAATAGRGSYSPLLAPCSRPSHIRRDLVIKLQKVILFSASPELHR